MILGQGMVGILIHLGLDSSPVGTWTCVTFSHGRRDKQLGSCLKCGGGCSGSGGVAVTKFAY